MASTRASPPPAVGRPRAASLLDLAGLVEMKNNNPDDLGQAAKALVFMHTSPLVTMQVDQRIMFPPLDLNSNEDGVASDVAAHNLCKLMMANTRPRSHSLSALEYRPKPSGKMATASSSSSLEQQQQQPYKRPRSMSMAAAAPPPTSVYARETRSKRGNYPARHRSFSMGSYNDGLYDEDSDFETGGHATSSRHNGGPPSGFDPNAVGAYSPETRKLRVARFLEKRQNRIWRKSIKYNVRKNFADSRLRVKGRFVRKEDELVLKDYMSLT